MDIYSCIFGRDIHGYQRSIYGYQRVTMETGVVSVDIGVVAMETNEISMETASISMETGRSYHGAHNGYELGSNIHEWMPSEWIRREGLFYAFEING